MTQTLIRARLLTFHREPQTPDDRGAALTYIEDGALLVRGRHDPRHGRGARRCSPEAQIIDHRPHLLMPGFIDTHLHFPQTQVIGKLGGRIAGFG